LFDPGGTKIIPANIGELLPALSLAYWIAVDGGFCKATHRVTLATHSYTLEEVNLLAKTLNEKFNLKCSVHKIIMAM